MDLVNNVLDFIFPRVSIVSDKSLDEKNSNQYIGDDELNLLDIVGKNDLLDLKSKIISEDSFSLFAFREGDEFSKIIYQLKYGGMKRLGIFLGNLVGQKLEKYLRNNTVMKYEVLIPVPLFLTKFRERGYNQTDFICKGMNEKLGIQFLPHIIKRTRHTSSQTKLSREERIENIKDAFIVEIKFTEVICGRDLILVDDVITTGSTMNEAIKVLKKNGSGNILACSLAMAR